jgi:AbrB family looped-hinge helix DNA binding protein
MSLTKKATMDAAGRLVLPKAIREQAGFRPGRLLEIRGEEDRVEIRVAPLEVDIVEAEDGLPLARPKEPTGVLTTETVREVLEAVRERRGEG